MEFVPVFEKIAAESFLAIVLTLFSVIIPVIWTRIAARQRTQASIFHREDHNLNLFRALSDRNQRLQLAAAAVLVERLKQPAKTTFERSERIAIIRALISVTKDAPGLSDDTGTSPELTKFVSDNVVRVLGAVSEGGRLSSPQSPMSDFDWQAARFDRAWLPGLDGRGIDFFSCSIRNAGLRGAHLAKAVFKDADLRGSVLRGADLSAASFENADLRGTNMAGAICAGSIFRGAKYDDSTVLPDGLDPARAGMSLVGDQAIRVA